MICTNPDLIVDRGKKRELCAGSVALVFEKMGGEIIILENHFLKFISRQLTMREKEFCLLVTI